MESLHDRVVPAVAVRPIDGTGNNIAHADWGSTNEDFLRRAPAAYEDGLSTPAGADRPSAREISNVVAAQGDLEVLNNRDMSAMVYAWGQFIDHDLDATEAGTTESFPVAVPTGDPSFDPNGTGTQTIDLTRSAFDANTGTEGPRQQVNTITAWLDGSMVYGSDAITAASLRTMQGGRLKTSLGNLLPVDDAGFFRAGDARVNENPELTSMQTVFVREHNRIADRLHRANPRLTDEQMYQQARAQVIGEVQAITYNEWLPVLLGPNAVPAYRGYNSKVNPGITNEFATAGFRFGHSLLGDDIQFLGNDGLPVADEVALKDAFFNPTIVQTNGVDPILKYLASDLSSEVDTKVVDSLRNFLFGEPGQGGFDLASLNIQRGRDHGLADYNTTRVAYGLPPVTDFAQITHNVDLQNQLRDLYGSVNNIDLWVGTLAEDHVPGGSVGPTAKAIISDQFARLRDADRFWYQREFSGTLLSQIRNTHLSDVIERDTQLRTIQANAFLFHVQISGVAYADLNRSGRLELGDRRLAGVTVQLIDATSGDIVAQTQTRQDGSYRFTAADGVATGRYEVRQILPPHIRPTTPPRTIAIVSGDTAVHLDLGSAPELPPA